MDCLDLSKLYYMVHKNNVFLRKIVTNNENKQVTMGTKKIGKFQKLLIF